MAKARTPQETAWVIDEERIAASVDGTYIAGMPGLWRAGEAIHPEALGMTVGDFRDLVAELDLPLRETSVREGTAVRAFYPAEERLETAPVGTFATTGVGDGSDELVPDEPTIGDEVTMEHALDAMRDTNDEGADE
jgi:hypothetical protein